MIIVKRIDYENIKLVEHVETQTLHPSKGLLSFKLRNEIAGYRMTFKITFNDGHLEIVKRNYGTYDCDVLLQYIDGTVDVSEVSMDAKRLQRINRILLIIISVIILSIGTVIVAYISHENSFYTEINGKRYVVAESVIRSEDFIFYKEDGTKIQIKSSPGWDDPYFIEFSHGDETGRGIKIGNLEKDFLNAYKGAEEGITEYSFSGMKCYSVNFPLAEGKSSSQAIYFFVENGKITEIYAMANTGRNKIEEAWSVYKSLNPSFVFYKEYDADDYTRKQICLWLPMESYDDDSIINIWKMFNDYIDNAYVSSGKDDYEIKIYCKNKSLDEYYLIRTEWVASKYYYEITDRVSTKSSPRLIEVYPYLKQEDKNDVQSKNIPFGHNSLEIDPENYNNALEYAEDAVGVDWDTIEEAIEYFDDNN